MLARLTYMPLQNNQLSGPLPSEIGHLASLSTLSLYYNKLEGLPTEIGNMRSLWNIELYNNSISSPLPSEIGNLPQVHTLDLYNNQISGSLPSEVCVRLMVQ